MEWTGVVGAVRVGPGSPNPRADDEQRGTGSPAALGRLFWPLWTGAQNWLPHFSFSVVNGKACSAPPHYHMRLSDRFPLPW